MVSSSAALTIFLVAAVGFCSCQTPPVPTTKAGEFGLTAEEIKNVSIFYDPHNKELLKIQSVERVMVPKPGQLSDLNNGTGQEIKAISFQGSNVTTGFWWVHGTQDIYISELNSYYNFSLNVSANIENFSFTVYMLVNNQVVINQTVSQNTQILCIPLPYVPFVSFCIQLSSIGLPGGKYLTFCVSLIIQLFSVNVIVLQLGCLTIPLPLPIPVGKLAGNNLPGLEFIPKADFNTTTPLPYTIDRDFGVGNLTLPTLPPLGKIEQPTGNLGSLPPIREEETTPETVELTTPRPVDKRIYGGVEGVVDVVTSTTTTTTTTTTTSKPYNTSGQTAPIK